jgi:hypothetical protein
LIDAIVTPGSEQRAMRSGAHNCEHTDVQPIGLSRGQRCKPKHNDSDLKKAFQICCSW